MLENILTYSLVLQHIARLHLCSCLQVGTGHHLQSTGLSLNLAHSLPNPTASKVAGGEKKLGEIGSLEGKE